MALIARYTVRRGRSFERDEMETGQAEIFANDVEGILDPTNTGGPYYGNIEPRKQAAIGLHNPVTDEWTTIFRGFVEEWDYEPSPSQVVTRPDIRLADAFLLFGKMEMLPGGGWGDAPPAGAKKFVFFEDTAGSIDDRVIQILGNAGWDPTRQSVFSGNVRVMETSYSAGETVLAALQECADAEFPGVSNHYMSKNGIYTWHGRLARFDYTNPDYGITVWKAGDGAAVQASISDTAHIRAMRFNRGLDKLINSAIAYPQGIKDADMAGQVVTDSTSITTYGTSSWSAPNLLTSYGILTGNDANDETRLFALYYVNNYAVPRNRIEQLVFKSMHPDDPRAAANWAFLCGVELNDVVEVTVELPGGGGFTSEPYFIEGISYEVQPLQPSFPLVTMTLDLSPQAYFTSNPFEVS